MVKDLGLADHWFQRLVPGCQDKWRQLLSVVASYICTQNAHPFADVWWMGGGEGVEWKGRGMADYSDTYRNGGLRYLIGRKKKDLP